MIPALPANAVLAHNLPPQAWWGAGQDVAYARVTLAVQLHGVLGPFSQVRAIMTAAEWANFAVLRLPGGTGIPHAMIAAHSTSLAYRTAFKAFRAWLSHKNGLAGAFKMIAAKLSGDCGEAVAWGEKRQLQGLNSVMWSNEFGETGNAADFTTHGPGGARTGSVEHKVTVAPVR